jgi:Peptidase family M28/PDZ domain
VLLPFFETNPTITSNEMKKSEIQILVCFIWFLALTPSQAQTQIAVLQHHIEYLSSDKLQGRSPGTKGEAKAAKYISKAFKKLGLKPMGTDGFYHPFTWKQNTNPHAAPDETNFKVRNGKNVVALLDNGAAKTIVIGAHYDHLGLGYDGNSLDANPEGKIHNGADDNASGVAGLIELARMLKADPKAKACNYLFIAFSGEEAGLIGSKRFCETPTIALDQVKAMINMDMIGRLEGNKGLVVGGIGTSADLDEMVNQVPHEFSISLDSAGSGPSDHTSFYLKNIPVLFFFTGAHGDYHKPSDDADKINYNGELQIINYVQAITIKLAQAATLPFTPTRNPAPRGASFKVTLGVMPDYSFDGPGMRIDGVSDGKPAAKAGLLTGDIVLKLGDHEVLEMQSYMDALSKFAKGDTTTVQVKRKDEILTFPITL